MPRKRKRRTQEKSNRFVLRSLLAAMIFGVSVLSVTLYVANTQTAQACCGCTDGDCNSAEDLVNEFHERLRENTKDEFDADLREFERWMEEIYINEIVQATAAMATQMGAVAMQYTEIVGSFLDAQTQLDTQRLLRELQLEAHKDYRPSHSFCTFGTNVTNLVGADSRAAINSLVLGDSGVNRQLGALGTVGGSSEADDYKARWSQFVKTYCDPRDNNFHQKTFFTTGTTVPEVVVPLETGLYYACDHDEHLLSFVAGSIAGFIPGDMPNPLGGARDPKRMNRDINFVRLVNNPRTLDVDFTNTYLETENPEINTLIGGFGMAVGIGVNRQPGEEEDVIAMSRNLYGHRILTRNLSRGNLNSTEGKTIYMSLRSMAAKRSVAQASFNAIVGLKSVGTSRVHWLDLPTHLEPDPGVSNDYEERQAQRYLAAIVNELIPADPAVSGNDSDGGNIFDLIGYSPSYYSQLEIIAKRIYQNPDFYADLYDTPANVTRKKVAMQAIELMVDREIYESQLRREMTVSVLLSTQLRSSQRTAARGLKTGEGRGPTK